MENDKVKNVLNQILNAFESGNIPDAIAIASFPIPDIPSAKWSIRNRTIAALSGTIDARGYKQWLSAKRYVKSGSKAVYILSPCIVKKDEEQEENEDTKVVRFFKATAVFKVEDTDGEPLNYKEPQLPDLPLLERARELGVSVKAIHGNLQYYGFYSPDRKEIALATPSEKTFFHELSHAAEDHIVKGKLKRGQDPFQEITAELASQVLARLVGKSIQDTTGNSYQYIKRYAEKIKLSPYKACLTVLSRTEKILDLLLHGNASGVITAATTEQQAKAA
ncbi:MAG: antirestriction protein [Desulfamplus sp.]|nr:antirestriction protein [Desulfamplus sp.]